jgi:hypothetical protein
MAKWQFTKNGLPTNDPIFDDGLQVVPGDPDFSTDAVKAAMPADADGFNYVGTSS